MSQEDIWGRIAEIERKLSMMMWPATVAQRDHVKGVRFEIAKDDDGNPVLSAWVQPPDNNKGTRSRWLPQVGSQHLVMTPAGHDTALSFLPMSHHDASPNPATSADETVIFDDGTCRIAANGGVITLKAGGSTLTIADGKIESTANLVQATGASQKHNDKEIGSSHKHTQVMPGDGDTGVPA